MTYSPVAGVSSTLSKNPALFPESLTPFLIAAEGSQVATADGRNLTDWISGLLAVTLGHAHREVNEAVINHLKQGGPTWSLPHYLETEVAETILRLTGYDNGQVRFFKTGSEANSAAVRIARAVTGRRHIAVNGYHGWHDALLTTPPAWGRAPSVMGYVSSLPFNHLELWSGLESTAHDHACIIVEPETVVEPERGWLEGLRKLCDETGMLLIFDEAITGGRYPNAYTAARHYGVQPDLLILSKSLANGWPLACVVGKREYMRSFDVGWSPDYVTGGTVGPVYASGTFSGETSGLAAASATLAIWERDKVAERIWETGKALKVGLIDHIGDCALDHRVQVKGPPYRLLLDCPNLEDKTRIMARLLERGHLIGTGWNITAAHTTEDVESVIDAFRYALNNLHKPAGRRVVAPYRQA